MKSCPRCGENLPLNEFGPDPRYRSGRRSWCRACERERGRAYARTADGRDLQRARQRRHRAALRAAVDKFKRRPCADCGAEFPPHVMDLHHRDSAQKEFTVADACNRGVSLATLQRELDKCAVLCANCHRQRHAPRERMT